MAAAVNKIDPSSFDGSGRNGGYDPWAIEPMPEGLIDSPLDFIFADHHRQREAAQIITMIADGEFDKAGVENLVRFLEVDFALHIGDEELALFPILREHCLEEDNVGRIIERLKEEHREDEAINTDAIDILKQRLAGGSLPLSNSRRLRQFAEHIRQHLALENGVLLPLARVRLGAEALETLSGMLKERR